MHKTLAFALLVPCFPVAHAAAFDVASAARERACTNDAHLCLTTYKDGAGPLPMGDVASRDRALSSLRKECGKSLDACLHGADTKEDAAPKP